MLPNVRRWVLVTHRCHLQALHFVPHLILVGLVPRDLGEARDGFVCLGPDGRQFVGCQSAPYSTDRHSARKNRLDNDGSSLSVKQQIGAVNRVPVDIRKE